MGDGIIIYQATGVVSLLLFAKYCFSSLGESRNNRPILLIALLRNVPPWRLAGRANTRVAFFAREPCMLAPHAFKARYLERHTR